MCRLDIVRAQELGVRGKRLALLKDGEAVLNNDGVQILPCQVTHRSVMSLKEAGSSLWARVRMSWQDGTHAMRAILLKYVAQQSGVESEIKGATPALS